MDELTNQYLQWKITIFFRRKRENSFSCKFNTIIRQFRDQKIGENYIGICSFNTHANTYMIQCLGIDTTLYKIDQINIKVVVKNIQVAN